LLLDSEVRHLVEGDAVFADLADYVEGGRADGVGAKTAVDGV